MHIADSQGAPTKKMLLLAEILEKFKSHYFFLPMSQGQFETMFMQQNRGLFRWKLNRQSSHIE